MALGTLLVDTADLLVVPARLFHPRIRPRHRKACGPHLRPLRCAQVGTLFCFLNVSLNLSVVSYHLLDFGDSITNEAGAYSCVPRKSGGHGKFDHLCISIPSWFLTLLTTSANFRMRVISR
jgi:hypothetical protein